MKKLFWLVTGVAVGLAASKQIEKNPKAKAAYDSFTANLKTVADALVESFEEGYAEEAKAPVRAKAKPKAKPASKAAAK